MNLFLIVCKVFSFVFWKNPRPEKKMFRGYLTFNSVLKKHAAYHRLIVIFHVNCAVDNCERYGGKASLVFSFVELVTVQYGEFVYTVNIELNP